MTTNAPYHIEYYAIALADESDPNPTLEYDAHTPNAIFTPVENLFTYDNDARFVDAPEIDLDPLTSAYRVYINGHESSYGTLVGTMYVTSIS